MAKGYANGDRVEAYSSATGASPANRVLPSIVFRQAELSMFRKLEIAASIAAL
ncbi:hypothetical protein [Sphingobium vermicomposti]|nr:hypothetical protein [Sphingobium vermicomposti]